MTSIVVIPGLELEIKNAEAIVSVKGETPQLEFPFSLVQLYTEIPSLDVLSAYRRLQIEMEGVDKLLNQRLSLRGSCLFPDAKSESEALQRIAGMFVPLNQSRDVDFGPHSDCGPTIFRLDVPRPFALIDAGSEKLLDSLRWIDTNIKVLTERLGTTNRIPHEGVIDLARRAMIVYCCLVKMDEYNLIRTMNFNVSMFIQERILNLFFGDALYWGNHDGYRLDALQIGKLSNKMALELLRGLGALTPRQLCLSSLYMGVVWTSRPSIQEKFRGAPDKSLAELEESLQKASQSMGIDHIERFLQYVGKDKQETILFALDDNGESVFDLALVQLLLRETGNISVDLLVNRFPVSNNISLPTVLALLDDKYFANLRKFLDKGRANFVVEEQVFNSPEYVYLGAATRKSLKQASVAYIKGANYFETFQPLELTRYYGFIVHSVTSCILSGYDKATGVFAEVSSGCEGYIYNSSNNIFTLKQQIDKQNQKGD